MPTPLLKLRTYLTRLLCPVMLCGSLSIAQTSSSSAAPNGLISVSGQVLNAVSKAPVPRALVQLNGRAVLTDHEGKFTFSQFDGSGLTGGRFIQVQKPGYYAASDGNAILVASISSDQLASPITLQMYPESLLTGTLIASDGTPLSRVSVTARRLTYSDTGQQWTPAGVNMTNSRGEFRLAVAPGDYKVETGYQPRMAGTSKSIIPSIYPAVSSSNTSDFIHLAAGAEEHLDLRPELVPTYPVSLRIDPSPDRGFPMIMAQSSTGATFPVSFSRFATEGSRRIELPAGTYTLTATINAGEASEYGETTVTVTPQNTSEAILHLAPAPTIPVQIIADQSQSSTSSTSDNAPPSLQQMGLMLSDTQHAGLIRGNGQAILTTGADHVSYFRPAPGTYRLVSHSGGRWYVKAAAYGTTDLLTQDLVVTQGSGNSPIVLTVSNQTGALQGTTVSAGVPSSGWVYLIPTGPSAASVFPMRSNSDGTYNFAYLPPGDYQAIAFEQRHQDNYRNREALSHYSTYIKTITINAGNKASLDLVAVPASEVAP
ncbi:carboxypeptidase-like regulatory domain-containing protein [Edaphobacter flagellatus]|uniref:carboxypeptidase-like regulatory domain-containing protein n=1 Tax=Edaphobacter flagellatus TaxID=1933044 RepID=UPI0021B2FF55|nr:hypothetical protein [Edaphobacter flagellatus]